MWRKTRDFREIIIIPINTLILGSLVDVLQITVGSWFPTTQLTCSRLAMDKIARIEIALFIQLMWITKATKPNICSTALLIITASSFVW
jgi:hypothetical protein